MPPPQANIKVYGSLDGASKILDNLNFDADQAILSKAQRKISIKITDIYTEAEVAIPAAQTDDEELWEIADDCIAAAYRIWVSVTPQDKDSAKDDMDDCMTAIKLHIGIVDSKDDEGITEPATFVGPYLTKIGVTTGDSD